MTRLYLPLLYLLLSVINTNVFGQSSVKEQTDSLKIILKSNVENEELKIETYLGLYWVNRNYALLEAKSFLNITEALLKESSNKRLVAKYLHYSAVDCYNSNEVDQFRERMDSSIMMLEKMEEPELLYEILMDYGYYERDIGTNERALKRYDNVLDLAKKYTNTNWAAKAYLGKSKAYIFSWQVEKCYPMLKMADSLYQLTSNQHGLLETEYIRNYALYQEGNLIESLELAKEGEEKCRKWADEEIRMEYVMLQAQIHYHLGDYPKAFPFYHQAYDYYENQQNRFLQIKWINKIAYANRMIGNFEESINFTYQSISINDSLGSLSGEANCYINLSNVYNSNKQIDKSLEMITKALVLFKKTNNERGVASTYNSYGNAYELQGSFEKALEAYENSFEIRKKQSEAFWVIPLYNIGNILLLMEKPIESMPYFQRSLDVCLAQSILGMKIRNLLGMADANLQFSNFKKARELIEQSESLVRDTNYQDMKRDTYELMSRIYAQNGNYELAYDSHVKHKSLEDSIFNRESNERYTNLEVRYETNKKVQENLSLKKDIELKETSIEGQKKIIIAVIIILVLTFAGVLYTIRNNKILSKKNKLIESQKNQLEERNKKIETLFKEIHHRVKNNLQIISGLLDVQRDWNNTEISTNFLDDSRSRLTTMSLIHQNLYENSDVTTIDFQSYLEQLIEQIKVLYSHVDNVDITLDALDVEFDIDTAIPLGLILNELITNAFKYSFNNSECNCFLKVRLLKTGIGQYELALIDNGNSLPKPLEELVTTGFGLRLASRLSKQLHGSLSHIYDEGNQFTISFKDTAKRLEIE